jgi:hypothetical protein
LKLNNYYLLKTVGTACTGIHFRNLLFSDSYLCTVLFTRLKHFIPGPGSSVGIAPAYGLEGPGIEFWWGSRFSAPVQTGPEAHTSSCEMGTGSFPGVRCGLGVTLTPHSLPVPRSEIEYSYTSTLLKGLRGL